MKEFAQGRARSSHRCAERADLHNTWGVIGAFTKKRGEALSKGELETQLTIGFYAVESLRGGSVRTRAGGCGAIRQDVIQRRFPYGVGEIDG